MTDYLPTSIKNLNTKLGEQLLEGGGGGGSSDFSTATVTVVGSAKIQAPQVVTAEESGAPVDFIQARTFGFDPIADTTITVALYKGLAIINVASSQLGKTITVSGNIEYVGDDAYMVRGDCTITIS